jgi:hypothetical protein
MGRPFRRRTTMEEFAVRDRDGYVLGFGQSMA